MRCAIGSGLGPDWIFAQLPYEGAAALRYGHRKSIDIQEHGRRVRTNFVAPVFESVPVRILDIPRRGDLKIPPKQCSSGTSIIASVFKYKVLHTFTLHSQLFCPVSSVSTQLRQWPSPDREVFPGSLSLPRSSAMPDEPAALVCSLRSSHESTFKLFPLPRQSVSLNNVCQLPHVRGILLQELQNPAVVLGPGSSESDCDQVLG